MDELLKRFDPTALQRVIANPQENALGVAILMAGAVLLVLIVLLTLLAFALPDEKRKRGPKRPGQRGPKPGGPRPKGAKGPRPDGSRPRPKGARIPPTGAPAGGAQGRPGAEAPKRPRPAGAPKPPAPGSVRASDRPEPQRPVKVIPPMPRKKRNPMVSLGVTALILFAFTLSVYIPAGFSSYCSTCHTVSLEAKTWRKGVHRSVACISCHEPDPVVRFPQYAARRVINQVKYEVSHPKRARLSEVDDSGCIGCHRDDITTITVGPADTRSIRMRHSDVVGAGYHCTDCHRTTGHAVVAKAPSGLGGMTRCLECHRDGKAPTACDTCHVEDVMSFAARRTGPYPKTALAAKDCQTCHATDRCTSCHGLQLPHSDAFVEGGHARQAAFEKKRSCWRCHKPGECSKCHVLGKERFSAHAPDWKTTHPSGVTNLDNPGNCRSCHNKSEGPFCRRCH